VNPRISVVVRSFNRIAALCELLEVLLNQEHDSFEIVVIEQSIEFDKNDYEILEYLSKDSRLNVYKYPPLGGPKARNKGIEHSKGEIIIFVDDDDLPTSKQWIKKHEVPYRDEKLVGFTGRHVGKQNKECPYLKFMRWFIRRTCMSYSFLGTPYTFARFDEDVKDVEWLHGTNSYIRKEWALEAGLWDTTVKNQDEHSFAFKLKPLLKNGYRLDFRKEPELIRRLDIDGGMEKRGFSAKREFKNQHGYIKNILFKYRSGLKPLYPLLVTWASIKVGMQMVKRMSE
jgi:glycosyltransferase involved in cell wall biosynthesis